MVERIFEMTLAITKKMPFAEALSCRTFATLWSGQTISSLGDGAFMTAVSWQVLMLTGSATAMGLIMIAQTLPMILFLLLGGVVADRFPRKQVMLLSDASRAIAVLAIAVLALTHTLQLWHLIVLALFFGIVRGFFMPAYQSLIPHLVSKDQLASANSLTELSYQIYALVGPIVGASCIAFGGPAAAFGFDGLTFLFSALCLSRLHLPAGLSQATSPAPSVRSERKATASQLREGLGYIARLPFLWITMALAAISSIGGAGALQVALPKLVVDVYGQGVWFLGLIWAAGGVGSLLAILLTAQFNRLRRRGIVLYLTMAVSGLALIGLALPLPHGVEPVVACTAMALLNASMTLHEILWVTVMQERVPDDKLGRVSSINQLAGYGFWPLGFVLAGALADHVSPAMVFLGAGIVTAVLYSLCLCLRSIRQVQSFGTRQNEAFEEQKKEKHMIHSEISQLEPLEVALAAFQQQYPTSATQPQQGHLPLSERCVCGYQDHRARKVFCPHCGRPLAGVAHPSVKARSSHLEYAGRRSPPGCPALSPESLM